MLPQQAPVPAQLSAHSLLRDRYSILAEVGTGGFGSVYKATDTHNGDRLVAIKEVKLGGLHPQAMAEASNAFEREVSLLSRLDHPNLPHLYEHFRYPGSWYLVMEFIVGETLEEYQNRAPGRHLLLSDVFAIGLQLCTVLDYLHSHHPPIVFRDLKPSNVMRTPAGQIYLIDFGIARYFKQGQAKDTVALGSIGYAPPEQYGKAQTTPRADIYSLGVVLHQLLTTSDPSEAPFRFAPLRPQSLQGHSDPGSLTTSMVDVMINRLERLIASMLAMDKDSRPPDIASVREELDGMSKLWHDIYKRFWRPKLGHVAR